MNMKTQFIALSLCLLAFCSVVEAKVSSRKSSNFNREWKYMRGDHQGAEQIIYDDSGWEQVGLPHSFSIPYFMSKDFYTGYGWYRKSLKLTENELSQSIFLEFDGVFQEAEIFINAKPAGNHVGGYTGFSIDISSLRKLHGCRCLQWFTSPE